MSELDENKIQYNRFKKLISKIVYAKNPILDNQDHLFVHLIIEKMRLDFEATLNTSTPLFRARINEIKFEAENGQGPLYPPNKMGPPPKELAISGRINPPGTPYLYCAFEYQTAASEVNPKSKMFLTIAKIRLRCEIKIIDLTSDVSNDPLKDFYRVLSQAFSIQWHDNYKDNYLITQFISDHLIKYGYRGVKYKSGINEEGNNLALFYPEDYEITETFLVWNAGVKYYIHPPGHG